METPIPASMLLHQASAGDAGDAFTKAIATCHAAVLGSVRTAKPELVCVAAHLDALDSAVQRKHKHTRKSCNSTACLDKGVLDLDGCLAARFHSYSTGVFTGINVSSSSSSSSSSTSPASSVASGPVVRVPGRAKSFTLGQASRAHPCSRLGNCSTATPGCPRRPATACSALPATGRRVGGGNSGSGNSGACSGSHSRSNAHKLHLLTGYLAADIRGGCCSSTGSYSSGSSRCQSPAAAAAAAQGDEGLARGLSAIFARPLGCSTAPMAELVEVEDIAKGFAAAWWHSRRQLDVFDGRKAAAPREQLLQQLPHWPGLHLWLVRPPCSRYWVPVHLAAATSLRLSLAAYLHPDGSCGPVGFKQKVLLDLMCRGFAVQVRYRPLKSGCCSAEADLLAKLQLFDFALNDADNNGCRPIELPNGWPVHSYPLVVQPMMQLYESLFGPRGL